MEDAKNSPIGESRTRLAGIVEEKKRRKEVISVGIGYSFLRHVGVGDTGISLLPGRLEKFLTRRDFWDDTRSTACRRGWNERASHNATRSYR